MKTRIGFMLFVAIGLIAQQPASAQDRNNQRHERYERQYHKKDNKGADRDFSRGRNGNSSHANKKAYSSGKHQGQQGNQSRGHANKHRNNGHHGKGYANKHRGHHGNKGNHYGHHKNHHNNHYYGHKHGGHHKPHYRYYHRHNRYRPMPARRSFIEFRFYAGPGYGRDYWRPYRYMYSYSPVLDNYRIDRIEEKMWYADSDQEALRIAERKLAGRSIRVGQAARLMETLANDEARLDFVFMVYPHLTNPHKIEKLMPLLSPRSRDIVRSQLY